MPTPALVVAASWLLFLSYSFFGWVMESCYCSIGAHHLINRGFLNGPYIPLYGVGSMLSAVVFSRLPNLAAVFLVSGLVSCVIEYVTSYAMERLYHARWWDYSHMPLNLNGRVWIGGYAEFGVCCVIVVLVNPMLKGAIEAIPPIPMTVGAIVTFTAFVIDFVVTNVGMAGLREKMDYLRMETLARLDGLRESLPSMPEMPPAANWGELVETHLRPHLDMATHAVRRARKSATSGMAHIPLPSLDELAETFASRLSRQERRVMRAFPTLRPSNYRALITERVQRIQDAARGARQGKD